MREQIALEDQRLLGCPADVIVDQLPQRLSHGILAWADKTPDQLALIGPSAAYTYADLATSVKEAQSWLEHQNVVAGSRVMFIAENGPVLMVFFLALSEIGAVGAVINARLSAREIDLIATDCDPSLIVCTTDNSVDAKEHGERVGASLSQLSFGTFQYLTKIAEPQEVSDDPSELVLAMIYTTGTTGTPKGVMLTHQNLMFIAFVSGKLRGIEAGDQIYCVLPMSHVFGLSAVSSSTLFAGGCVHLIPKFDAQEVVNVLSDQDIKGFLGVPTMYALMLEAAPDDWAPKALKFMYSGGSPLDPALKRDIEARFGLPLHNGYGLTETGPTVCQTRLFAPLDSTSVGFPLPGEEIKVVGKDGSEMAQGEIGELWVKGPNVMKGYFRKPEATAEVLQDGWFNTGDLVFVDPVGAIHIAGRSKELIIRSGFNIYPPEVEAVLSDYPSVSLCAVIGEPAEGNEEVVAYLQAVAGQQIDIDGLTAHAKSLLAGYKVPTRFIILESLPTAPSGKILKHQLKGR